MLPSYRNQWIDLQKNQLTGFCMWATLVCNWLNIFFVLASSQIFFINLEPLMSNLKTFIPYWNLSVTRSEPSQTTVFWIPFCIYLLLYMICRTVFLIKLQAYGRVSFFNEVAGLWPATLFKKRLLQRCFPVNFVKFLWPAILLKKRL